MKFRIIATICLSALAINVFSWSAVAKPKLTPCQSVYLTKFVRGQNHKAFATSGGRSQKADNLACAWAQGYNSKKQAELEALRQCTVQKKRHKLAEKCKVIQSK